MNRVPSKAQGQQPVFLPAPTRTKTVVMGQQGFIRVLLRLIGVEMYKIRRRTLSKALSSIGLLVMIAVFLVLSISGFGALNMTYHVRQQCPMKQNTKGQQGLSPGQICTEHLSTQQERAQAQKLKQAVLLNDFALLRLPGSLFSAVSVTMIVGTMLLVILAGTIVGGEYSGGTIRFIMTRGPTRVQFLLSWIGALLLCVVLGFVAMVLTGLVVGALLTVFSGTTTSLDFLQRSGWVHILLYPLLALFGLFICTMLALFLAILGRATTAGIAGVLIWFVLETILSRVLSLLTPSPITNFLKVIPDYFISNNINALLQNQVHYFSDNPPSAVSDLHALLVLVGYLVVFIALSLWVIIRRDIIN
jgi:ABC-type transport system involved in multi-copper enzyme maturation permease subunit